MPIRNNRNIRKVKPHIVRNIKRQPIHTRDNVQDLKPLNIDHKYSETKKIWNNETVYIIGGGPSLRGFNWNKLKGKKVIAINRAFQVIPWADVMYWTDSRFYRWYSEEIASFKGLKYTCRPFNGKPSDVVLLKSSSVMKIEMRPSYISHGNNSGFGAINLAVKLGASKIYLLGYDMKSNPKDTHWHDGYSVTHNHNIYKKMIKYFETLPSDLKKLNIEVFNANPRSELHCFRKCSLSDALNDLAFNPFKE